MRLPSKRQLSLEMRGTARLKSGGVNLQSRRKPILSCSPSSKTLRWYPHYSPETRFLVVEQEQQRCTPSLETARTFPMCILPPCIPQSIKYGTYPVGFPETHFNPADQNIFNYFGIAQVDILPPERLFHHVLPVREGGKLTFPLCRSCVNEEMAKPLLERSNMCGHSREERMLKGTWYTPDIQKAVEKGYQLIKIHEVFHFPPENQRTGLFEKYFATWLKLKQESAGWPADCDTKEKEAEYIRNYKEHEGIQLENVAENPTRKAIAKMLLNS